jgi:hypothetical protein
MGHEVVYGFSLVRSERSVWNFHCGKESDPASSVQGGEPINGVIGWVLLNFLKNAGLSGQLCGGLLNMFSSSVLTHVTGKSKVFRSMPMVVRPLIGFLHGDPPGVLETDPTFVLKDRTPETPEGCHG